MSAVAVVTGAGGGIGTAMVATLVKHGWAVVGVDLVDRPAVLDGVEWVVGDVRDESTISRALEAAARMGPVRGLVTATLTEQRSALEGLSSSALAEVLDVQVAAAWAWSTAVAREARTPDDDVSIVHVSSVHAQRAQSGMAAYAMGKAALDALVRAAAVEWGARGVRCNAVLPGFVPVDRNKARWSDPNAARELLANHPLGRFVTAEDVAQVVAFLLGPESRAVTGVSLPVDGGMLATLPRWA
ncbi:SDR family NAD(P)-dependent oxidoreductase [Kribbella sp. NPDC048928]|uniref:SDR family NAD(P)-dependent oxidoreductase n=1 Tax=Kribbella sp. NPDC048928 TaxID=3364111 RepID=UPI00370FF1DB